MSKPDSILAIGLACALVVGGFLLGRLWTIQSMGGSIDWPTTFEAWSHIAQVLALAVGAWWTYRVFVRQRVDKARANITHSIQSTVLSGNNERLVRAVVNIHNIGNVELRPPAGYTEVQVANFTPGQARVNWVMHGNKHPLPFKKDGLALEPGETERYSVDILIPASCDLFQVHTEVECGDHHKGDFWDETNLCSSEGVVTHV
jgi:ABC-type nickel/cobalt efflux system permease component RcnA